MSWGPSSFAQVGHESRTTVAPLPGEEILTACEYRLFVPSTPRPVRAVWTIYDRGLDHLKWFQDPEVRAFAREFDLALLLAMHCRSKEREDMIVIPEKGVGRALFTALDRFAVSEKRSELGTVRLIHQGWSGAGALVARMAAYRPWRYLAGIAYAPGQYAPLGMDTIELPLASLHAPQLIIANGADNVNGTARPYGYFSKYFEQGAPWTFAVQNRTPHCCLQNAKAMILEWLRGVLTANSGSWGTGEFGYLTVQDSAVKDEWNRPVFNATGSRTGTGGRPGEIAAGWMPSARFARQWMSFEGRSQPPAIWKP